MILQGAKPTIQSLGVGDVNRPSLGGGSVAFSHMLGCKVDNTFLRAPLAPVDSIGQRLWQLPVGWRPPSGAGGEGLESWDLQSPPPPPTVCVHAVHQHPRSPHTSLCNAHTTAHATLHV